MFPRCATLALLVSALIISQAAAAPTPERQTVPLRRVAEPLQVIQLYHRIVPIEDTSIAPDYIIEPYAKRDVNVEDAAKAPNGIIVPYVKRDVNVEDAAKAPNGIIVPYAKRDVNVEDAAKSPDGTIEPYKKRDARIL